MNSNKLLEAKFAFGQASKDFYNNPLSEDCLKELQMKMHDLIIAAGRSLDANIPKKKE